MSNNNDTQKNTSYYPFPTAWELMNLGTSILATSTVISLIHPPINYIIFKKMKSAGMGNAAANGEQASILSFINCCYKNSNFAGQSARTAYVTGTKKTSMSEENALPHEASELKENVATTKKLKQEVGFIFSASLGEAGLTQLFTMKAYLGQAGIIDSKFNWKTYHNIKVLSRLGFFPRFLANVGNFSALCILEEFFTQNVFKNNSASSHFFAGALSGMTASLVTSPLTYWRDQLVCGSKVQEGNLCSPPTFSVLHGFPAHMRTPAFFIAVSLGMTRTGLTFAFVSGLMAALGNEPLSKFNIQWGKTKEQTPATNHSPGFFKSETVKSVVVKKEQDALEASAVEPRRSK
ncbi:hypothetical protein NKV53_10840 [Legionella sp. 27cVA30]|uniref:hypothetical protein n=1 Tax=Legionella sp. 27cVA30 TaxID=2905657 RepID=UPI00209DF866|nr:hypothetical protein [Legionella sp. 27cVA30]MCP0914821.1 hypothetical protein [Legionella sp. 27cVA30]